MLDQLLLGFVPLLLRLGPRLLDQGGHFLSGRRAQSGCLVLRCPQDSLGAIPEAAASIGAAGLPHLVELGSRSAQLLLGGAGTTDGGGGFGGGLPVLGAQESQLIG